MNAPFRTITLDVNTVIEREPLLTRLDRRLRVELEAERTGKSMRRHPGRVILERLFVKPLLGTVLKATGLYARGTRNALSPVVRRLRVEFRHLPAAFDGYRILHLSDLHIDALPELADVVARTVRGLSADVCLMTGDYRCEIEGPCAAAVAGMRRVLENVGCPMYAILGNHDPCEIAAPLEELGVEFLINEAVELRRGQESIWVAGTDDSYDYRCDDLDRAMEAIPAGAFRVLMAHAPDLYQRAEAAGVNVYLCGHTHAGQVRLPWIGSVIENSDAPRGFTQGYWHHGRMRGYTSAGIGCSMLPIRFNCPPEIVVLELRRA